MPEVKVVIDGEEIILERNGKSRNGTYEKYKEPEKYQGLGPGKTPFIATIYRKPGWTPSKGK